MSIRTDAEAKSGPLAGFRILDLTSVVLGPMATQILADYGADVVKIEALTGDLIRANGVSKHQGMSSIFLSLNRNKRSLALDLKSQEGRRLLSRMLPQFDALVHNMRPAAMKRLGLDYESVRAINPAIVYCEATGFGADGPYSGRPALDDIIQAASGLCAVTASIAGEPCYVPSLIADKTAALALINAVLAALLSRERTGKGQHVEVPMLETLASFVLAEHMGGMTFDPPIAPAGYHRILSGGRQPVPTKDGHMAMLPYTETHWRAFFATCGREDIIDTYKINDRQQRNANVKKIYAELRKITPSKTTAEWMALCEELDVPASPIYRLDELKDHPHLRSVGLFETFDHPTEGRITLVRPPARFSETPARIRSGAPTVGQHSREVLAELGFAESEIAGLIADGLVRTEHARVEATLPRQDLTNRLA